MTPTRPRPCPTGWCTPLLALAAMPLVFSLPAALAAETADLLLSEVVEGSSNNKAIEIFNGTGATVDLAAAGYRIEIYFNDSTFAETVIPLVGYLGDGAAFVVADADADPAILGRADLLSGQNFFNGNDSIVLRRGGAVVDSFGRIAENPDPEWSGGGVGTLDRTLVRKPEVCSGDLDPDDPFDPSAEWEALPEDTFGGLGSHAVSADCPDGETCTAAAVVSCGAPVAVGNNADPGSTRRVDGYPCLASLYRGREVAYSFTPPADGTYRVALRGLGADLDLVVLGPGRCDPERCLAASARSGTGGEETSFVATAGAAYFFVVDGAQGVDSDYTLELTCPSPPVADFTFSELPTAGRPVRFFDTSQGEPASWSWDFGDGDLGGGRNPTHVYSLPGELDVTLTASNAAGSDAVTKSLTVAPAGAALTVTGPVTGEVDQALTFTASAAGCQPVANAWRWTTAGGRIVSGGTGAVLGLRWAAGGVKVLEVTNDACGGALGSHAVEVARRQASVPPAAPTNLTAEPLSSTELRLAWTDASTTEDGFLIEREGAGGAFEEIALLPADTTSAAVSVAGSLQPTSNPSAFRVRAFNAAGVSAASNIARSATAPESCDDRETLCLLDKRFRVEAEWRDFAGHRGVGHPVALTSDTGYFWFFSRDNVELVVKVLDGRALTDHYWVFYGALSNVEYRITVTDTETGNRRFYLNPARRFGSVGDTRALPSEIPGGSAGWVEPTGAVLPRVIGVDFGWSPQQPAAGSAVLFEDRSQFPPLLPSRSWEFGDGSDPVPSREITVDHRYPGSGTFDVTLEVTDLSGDFFVPETRTRRLQVTPPPEPRITVDGPAATGVNLPATFSAAADEHCNVAPQGWSWLVDGGAVLEPSDRQVVDVAWTTPGTKRVTVGNTGCSGVTARRSIQVVEDGAPPAECEPGPEVLCLRGNRFRVETRWRDFGGRTGNGQAVRLTGETGTFWFFHPANVELVLKILDGSTLNGRFWVFYGALSNVEYEIVVTDTATGNTKRYLNPAHRFASVGDTDALPGDPAP